MLQNLTGKIQVVQKTTDAALIPQSVPVAGWQLPCTYIYMFEMLI
jgi:hypothetical protein